MLSNKKLKVIIFGASEGGKNFINKQSEYEILAIADNDVNKIGKYIKDYLIISPNDIFKYAFEKLIITSMHFYTIKKQLIDKGLNPHLIIAPPKHFLKSVEYPFEHKNTLDFAKKSLKNLIENLNLFNINYFVDFGTLLGIVREGDLIPWDDDIDLSIPEKEINKLIANIDEIIKKINHDTNCEYHLNNDRKRITSIVLKFTGNNGVFIREFSLDIWIIHFDNGLAIQEMNTVPEYHFLSNDTLDFEGTRINVPKEYKTYLRHTYGDWEIPKRNTTFADYQIDYNK